MTWPEILMTGQNIKDLMMRSHIPNICQQSGTDVWCTQLNDPLQFQKREMRLPEADGLLSWVNQVLEAIPSTCDHTLCSCRRALSWVLPCCLMNSSPHVQLSSSPVWQTTWDTRWLTQPQRKCITWPLQKANARHTVKALDPVSWPEDKFDMKYGGAEVLHLCKVLSGVKRGVFLCTCYIRSSTKSCQDCCFYH